MPPKSKGEMPIIYLKHRGLFNHAQLVKGIQQWFTENNYKFHASKYKLKANEAEYEMDGERDVTEYVRYKISIHIWARDIVDVEVVKDGEKKKMQDGYIQMDITGQLDYDYNKRFGGSKFMQWLHGFYQEYIIKQTITDVWEDDLFFKINQLTGAIKHMLGSETA